MKIEGSVCMITGASSGLGMHTARILADRGASTVLVARNIEALRRLAAQLEAAGRPALAVQADVRDREALDAAVAAGAKRFGRIDLLMNNAGVGYFGPVETMSTDDLRRVTETNVFGLVEATQATLPELKKSRGMIINISSGLAYRALPLLTAYAAGKAMVNAISDGLRLELAPYGIRVLNYCPPAADSGFDARTIAGPGMDLMPRDGMHMAASEDVAADIVKCIQRERPRAGSSGLQIMNFLAPRLMDRIFSGLVRSYFESGAAAAAEASASDRS